VYTRADLVQAACMYNSKKKMKTGSPDQEEASGIDNQGPLKAWMLFLTKKKIMQGITRQKTQSEIGL
jgi:hypothetical protein